MRRYSHTLSAAWELQDTARGTSEFAAVGETVASHIRTIRSGTAGFGPGESDHGYTTSRRKLRCRPAGRPGVLYHPQVIGDRKSTRLNSSHLVISYAVFCLKKKQ